MRKKNKLSTVIFLLINLIIIIIPNNISAQSQSITVQGYIYINNVITKPDEVSLILPNEMRHADIDDYNSQYIFIFPKVDPGTTGTFLVVIGYKSFTPKESLTIEKDVFYYEINLHMEIPEEELPEEPIDQTNYQPIAIAGGPYYEIVNNSIDFNGTESYDNDGTITKYQWEFGDGANTTGASPTYTYEKTGNYRVILTVSDNKGKKDLDITYAYITDTPNKPPTQPIINGTKSGSINTRYNFTIISIDADNDTIQYLITWDDDTDQTNSFFLQNGKIYTTNHSWIYPGIFTLTAYAIDEKGIASPPTRQIILIDTIYCEKIGYLTDYTGNGIYDVFHSNNTGEETPIQYINDGLYLIDNDNNGDYDYQYNAQTSKLNLYSQEETNKEKTSFIILINSYLHYIIVIIIILIIVLMILSTHKSKEKTNSTKVYEVKEKKKIQIEKPVVNPVDKNLNNIEEKIDKLLSENK